jgi:hypothetical protein
MVESSMKWANRRGNLKSTKFERGKKLTEKTQQRNRVNSAPALNALLKFNAAQSKWIEECGHLLIFA